MSATPQQLPLDLDPKTFGPRFEPGVLYIDSRVGSRELAPIFQKRHGAKISLTTLESADVAWCCGHTVKNPFCEGNRGCRVGVERKTLSDLVGSLMKSRLDGRQVPLMLKGYTMTWILVEGIMRAGDDDSIEEYRRGGWEKTRHGLTYSQLEGWLCRYEVGAYGRIQIARGLSTMSASAAFCAAKSQWWWKDWNKHHFGSIAQMHAPVRAMLFQANEYQTLIAALPNVGMVKMRKLWNHFGSIIEIMHATPRELQAAGLNKKLANDVYHMIRRSWR